VRGGAYLPLVTFGRPPGSIGGWAGGVFASDRRPYLCGCVEGVDEQLDEVCVEMASVAVLQIAPLRPL